MDITAIIDAREALAKLRELTRRATAPAMDAVAAMLVNRVALTFADQADPWGTPWAPLAKATIKRRRDKGRDGVSILRDTGQMLGALSGEGGAGFAEVRIGFAERPASIHQFGGKAGRDGSATIPARPMAPIRPDGTVALPKDWLDEVVDALVAHVAPGAA
jgi:phage virion morphogenesis protein